MRRPPLHIAIVGYGTAGQAAALALVRDGHRVEVFEQAPALRPVGAGFLLQPTGLAVLWELGLLDAALEHGRIINRLFGDNPRGRAVMDIRYADLGQGLFGLGMQRGALFEILRQAKPAPEYIHCDRRIDAVDESTRRLRDSAGRWHGPFDLLVIADGSASQLRQSVAPTAAAPIYPWGALWCLLPEGDWSMRHELRQRYRRASKMIGLLPVGGLPDDPTPRLSFFWSLREAEFPRWEEHGLDAWRDEVQTLWPELTGMLDHISHPQHMAQARYRDATPADWSSGAVCLMGDAAHAMSPQLGQGVNMALLDALTLRDALRLHPAIPEALAQYQQRRRRHVAIYQFWSRWLTPLFQSDNTVAAAARDAFLLPMGRLPGARGHMLRILTGTQQGWAGHFALPQGFVDEIAMRPPALLCGVGGA